MMLMWLDVGRVNEEVGVVEKKIVDADASHIMDSLSVKKY